MRPPAKPRVQSRPVTAKSAVTAPAAPSRTPRTTTPRATTSRSAAPPTEAIPRPEPAKKPPRSGNRRGRPAVSTAMTRRLAEKRAMRRHHLLKVAGLWAGGAVALAALVWVAFFSSLLALDTRRVEITGQGSTVDVAQVQQLVAEHGGTPLPRLDTVGLRAKILELAPVKDVRIMRVWPHGLEVTLTAREPVAAVPVEEGLALVDPEGVRVGTAGEAPAGVPVVHVALDAEHADALHAALHVVAGLPGELLAEVTEISAATRDDVRTTLASGQVIKWGSDARTTLKVAVVQALRQTAPDAQVFDVSSPTLPVTR